MPRPSWGGGDEEFWQAHFLRAAEIVYPRGRSAPPLLLVQTATLPSDGDGDQGVFTQLLAYHRTSDQFVRIYGHLMGSNNNQDVRYVRSGVLAGDMISAEPTGSAPFGYWIVVSALTPAYAYRQVMRYRSATHYDDGNPLAVIDSEMVNIESHLGIWRPGMALPLPTGRCPKPRLVHMELWCR